MKSINHYLSAAAILLSTTSIATNTVGAYHAYAQANAKSPPVAKHELELYKSQSLENRIIIEGAAGIGTRIGFYVAEHF